MTESGQRGRDGAKPGTAISRRALLASATILVGLAGCSGNGSEPDTTAGDDSEPTSTADMGGGDGGGSQQSTTTSGNELAVEPECRIESVPSALPVVGCQSEADQGDLFITTVVRNESKQTVNLNNFRMRVKVYETQEATLESEITANYSTKYPEGREVEPGQTLPLTHRMGLEESKTPEDVELYTITLF